MEGAELRDEQADDDRLAAVTMAVSAREDRRTELDSLVSVVDTCSRDVTVSLTSPDSGPLVASYASMSSLLGGGGWDLEPPLTTSGEECPDRRRLVGDENRFLDGGGEAEPLRDEAGDGWSSESNDNLDKQKKPITL